MTRRESTLQVTQRIERVARRICHDIPSDAPDCEEICLPCRRTARAAIAAIVAESRTVQGVR